MIADWSIKKEILLFVVMAIIVICSMKKPIYGLYFLLLLIFIRPQDDRPLLATLRLPMITMLIGTVAAIKAQKLTLQRLLDTPTFIVFILFLLIAHVSAVFAYNTHAAWSAIGTYYTIAAFFILIVTLLESEKDFDIFVFILLLCGIYFAYLLQFHGSDMLEAISGEQFTRRNFARLNINFGQPNYLAITMVIMNTFAFSLLLRFKNFFLKLFFGCLCLCYIYTLIMTASRGGTISLVFSIFLFGLLHHKGTKILIISIIFSILAAAILPTYFPSYFDRLNTIASYKEDESATGRLELWQDGLGFIRDNPLIGVGPDNFQELTFNSPHNSYIQMASELGIPGLFVWLMLLIKGFLAAKKAKAISRENNSIPNGFYYHSMAVQISLLACAAQSMTTGLGHREFLFMLIAMGASLSYNLSKREASSAEFVGSSLKISPRT